MSLFKWKDPPPEPGECDEVTMYHFRSRDEHGACLFTFEAESDEKAAEYVRHRFRLGRPGKEYFLVRVTTLRETLPFECPS